MLDHPKIFECFSDCLFIFRRALGLLGLLRFWQIVVLPHIQSAFSFHLRNIQGRNLYSTMLQHICLDLVISRSLLRVRLCSQHVPFEETYLQLVRHRFYRDQTIQDILNLYFEFQCCMRYKRFFWVLI